MFPVPYIRSSSVKQFDHCQMAYFAQYCLGIQSPSGPAALKGTTVHKVMDFLANAKLLVQQGAVEYTDKEIGYQFHSSEDIWKINVHRITDIAFDHYFSHRKSTKKERADVHDWVDMILTSSPRNLDPRNLEIVGIEKSFEIVLNQPWAKYDFEFHKKRYSGHVKIQGTIDLIVQSAPGVIEIIDWKTGERKDWYTGEDRSFAEFEQDIQVRLYHYAVSKIFPDQEVMQFSLYYVKDGGIFSIFLTEDDDQETELMIKNYISRFGKTCYPMRSFSDFCFKFCYYGKNRIDLTSPHLLLDQTERPMTLCRRIAEYFNERKTVNEVINLMGDPLFAIAEYKDPGVAD